MSKYTNMPVMQDMREDIFDRMLEELEEIKKLAVNGEILISDIKKRAAELRDKPGKRGESD